MYTKFKNATAFEQIAIGSCLALGIAMVIAANDGVEKNLQLLTILGKLGAALNLMGVSYSLKRGYDRGEFDIVFERVKIKYAEEIAKLNESNKKRVVVEKTQPIKSIAIPPKAAQKQYTKIKPSIGFVPRLQTSVSGVVNNLYIGLKKMIASRTTHVTPLPDDSVVFDNETKTSASAHKTSSNHKMKRHHQPNHTKPISTKQPVMKKSFSSSTTQIITQTPPTIIVTDQPKLTSVDKNVSEYSLPTPQAIPKKLITQLALVEDFQPAQLAISSVVSEEKNVPSLQVLTNQPAEVINPPVKSDIVSAVQLLEEVKVVLQEVKRQCPPADQTDALMAVNRSLYIQADHLASLAATQPGYENVCTAAQNFQYLIREHLVACNKLGLDTSKFYRNPLDVSYYAEDKLSSYRRSP